MAPHSSTLAWKIPWIEEPGSDPMDCSLRVGCDWATSLSLFPFMHWRRKWQPTSVLLPGEFQGQRSLVGCRLWGSHRVGRDWSDLAAAGNLLEVYWLGFHPRSLPRAWSQSLVGEIRSSKPRGLAQTYPLPTKTKNLPSSYIKKKKKKKQWNLILIYTFWFSMFKIASYQHVIYKMCKIICELYLHYFWLVTKSLKSDVYFVFISLFISVWSAPIAGSKSHWIEWYICVCSCMCIQ